VTLVTPSVPVLLTAALTLAGFVQAGAGWLAVRRFQRVAALPGPRPPVTVLKPLHGDEPLLEQALESFCRQDYPELQIVFGVQDATDTAIPVVARLRAKYPSIDMALVIDPTPHGLNRKVSNLINMFPSARHDMLLVSDSDMHAAPDYLTRVADALDEPGIGLVTSLYTGIPVRPGLTGQLGAAYINQSFAAGALMARGLGRQDCMGATMALTRDTLLRVGGFGSLSPFIADDAVLGMKIRALGARVALAASVPATSVTESSIRTLFGHELRWARTIRSVAPWGFAVSIIQFPAFWGLLTFLLSGFALWAGAVWLAAIAVRALTGRAVERAMGAAPTPLWLPALRDVLSMAVLLTSYMSDEVAWRGHVFNADKNTDYAARPVLARAGDPTL
jgi:ceramide glucosyltransferase